MAMAVISKAFENITLGVLVDSVSNNNKNSLLKLTTTQNDALCSVYMYVCMA